MSTALLFDLVVRGDNPAPLAAVLDPACALTIWERTLGGDLATTVDGLDLHAVDDIDDPIPTKGAVLHAAALLGAAGYAHTDAVRLAIEIETLVDRFAGIAKCEAVRLRLEIVETDACRRFHADAVTLRLLCTFRGAGTQWIEADAPETISQLPTGAVAIFKGRLLAEELPLLHRSPPVAEAGCPRLLFALDPIYSGLWDSPL